MQKSSTVKNLSMSEGGMLAIRRGLEDEHTEASGTLQTATREKESVCQTGKGVST